MAPPDSSDSSDAERSSISPDADSSDDSAFVYCRSCGAKAPSDWTFCRSCQSSLDDAFPSDNKEELAAELYTRTPDTEGEPGCPKCGRTKAEVEIVETTGIAVTPRIAAQNDRFRMVSCLHCGYCEFYSGGDPEILVDLFME